MPFTFYKQLNAMDCGPTCLRMVAKHYGKHYNTDTLRQKAGFSKGGVSLLGISETAEKLGFRSRGVKLTFDQLKEVELPCILHWNQNHFVVLLPFSGRRRGRGMRLKVADPAKGVLTYSKEEFMSHWISSETDENEPTGLALLLEPKPAFYEEEGEKEHKLNWKLVIQYHPLAHVSRPVTWRYLFIFIIQSPKRIMELINSKPLPGFHTGFTNPIPLCPLMPT